MDRRESIKSLLIGTLAGGTVVSGCTPISKDQKGNLENVSSGIEAAGQYGRTPSEKRRDKELNEEIYFTDDELSDISVLCDLILPPGKGYVSAGEAEVPEFIEFIAKDIQEFKIPLRGGLMWLNSYANRRFGFKFSSCELYQQKQILDEIAYPESTTLELQPGITFFSLMRNLTLTGFYTSQEGIKELNYQGNIANVWNGVPEEILAEHDVDYDEEWLAKCINQDTRNIQAEWDEDGNLIT